MPRVGSGPGPFLSLVTGNFSMSIKNWISIKIFSNTVTYFHIDGGLRAMNMIIGQIYRNYNTKMFIGAIYYFIT